MCRGTWLGSKIILVNIEIWMHLLLCATLQSQQFVEPPLGPTTSQDASLAYSVWTHIFLRCFLNSLHTARMNKRHLWKTIFRSSHSFWLESKLWMGHGNTWRYFGPVSCSSGGRLRINNSCVLITNVHRSFSIFHLCKKKTTIAPFLCLFTRQVIKKNHTSNGCKLLHERVLKIQSWDCSLRHLSTQVLWYLWFFCVGYFHVLQYDDNKGWSCVIPVIYQPSEEMSGY